MREKEEHRDAHLLWEEAYARAKSRSIAERNDWEHVAKKLL